MKRILFLCMILILISCSKKSDNNAKHKLKVTAMTIKKKIIEEKIYAVGTISHIEKVEITSKVIGKVEKVYVDVGSVVKKGSILLQIEKFPLEIELKKTMAELESAKSALQLAEAKYKEALKRVEQQIKVIEKARADLKDKEVSYENMKKIAERKKKLFEIGAITQEEYENILTELNTYETRYKLAKKELEIQLNGYRDDDIIKHGYKVPTTEKERIKILKKINTSVEKAEVDVQKAKVKNAEAEVASIKLLLEKTTIRSPLNGIVAVRNIEPGERVVKDTPLLVVMNIDNVYAILNVPESKVNQIKRHNKIELTVDAIPDKTFKGFVYLISPIVDLKTRTVEIRGKFRNPAHLLKPGMFARGYIFTGRKRESIIIPTSALITSQSNIGNVFVVMNKNEVYSKKIQFQEEMENKIEVLDGLKENDIVVINNADQLNDGDVVEVEYETQD